MAKQDNSRRTTVQKPQTPKPGSTRGRTTPKPSIKPNQKPSKK
jgi:hypothetical protein